MKNKFILTLVFLLINPCCTFAMTINSYFQQGLTVVNFSTQNILVSDPVSVTLNKLSIAPDYQYEVEFASDQFTTSPTQLFSHVVTINSAANDSVICTVTSDLEVSLTGISMYHPKASDEDRCKTSTYIQSGQYGMIYGFKIIVV